MLVGFMASTGHARTAPRQPRQGKVHGTSWAAVFRHGRTVPFCAPIWKPRGAPQPLDFVGGLRRNAERRATGRQAGQLDRILGAETRKSG